MADRKQHSSQGQMESPLSPRPSARARACAVPVPGGLRSSLGKLCSLSKVCAAPLLEQLDGGDQATKPPPRAGTGSGSHHYGGYDQRLLLARLFQTVGSLKSAYVRLQRAHVPYYDAARVAAADEAVTSELDSAAALQRLCGCSSGVGSLVNERWARVQGLEAEARRRDAEIARLRRELERLRRENSRLSRRVLGSKKGEAAVTTPAAVVEQFEAAARAVGDFAELFSGLLLTAASAEQKQQQRQQPGMATRHAVEAHLWRAMLGGAGGNGEREREGEEELDLDGGGAGCFDGIMGPRDPLDALMQFPRSGFSRFCRRSYLAAVPAAAEAAAFRRSLDQRAFVSRGGHPRTWFYRAFAAAARPAWALRVLVARCGCSDSESAFFYYARAGSAYAAGCMESVAAVGTEEGEGEGEGEEELRVAFTVAPGVRLGDAVVPARVLLCRRRPQDGLVQIR